MKILHFGGYSAVCNALAQKQISSGCAVTLVRSRGLEHALGLPCRNFALVRLLQNIQEQQFNIVHFHGLESLRSLSKHTSDTLSLEEFLKRLRESGAKLLFSSYGEGNVAGDPSKTHPEVVSLQEQFCHIFLGSANDKEWIENIQSWSFLGIALDLEAIPPPPCFEPQSQGLHILYVIQPGAEAEVDTIKEAVRMLRARHFKFIFRSLEAHQISNLHSLRSALKECDVLIEGISRRSFGYLAIEAMAQGKTVLSGNNAEARALAEQLGLCPVLDTNKSNFFRRTESILREPRCLRDLAKRSRQYVEKYHDVNVVGQMMMERYESV